MRGSPYINSHSTIVQLRSRYTERFVLNRSNHRALSRAAWKGPFAQKMMKLSRNGDERTTLGEWIMMKIKGFWVGLSGSNLSSKFTCQVMLNKLLILLVPWFPWMFSESNNRIYLRTQIWKLKGIMHKKYLDNQIYRTFSAKTGTVPCKLGWLVIL